MGIEDFNLDLEEHAERVLVITESDEQRKLIISLLEQRSFRHFVAKNITWGAKMAQSETFDLIVLDCSLAANPTEWVASLRSDPLLRRVPLIALAAEFEARETTDDDPLGGDVQLLPLPINPGELLLKVSTKLRLRKMKRNESRYDSQLSVQNAQLRDLTTRFKQELKEAQTVQQSLLPTILPCDPHTRFAAEYVPLEAVGGDMYDLWPISPGVFGLFIGDVTGHGLSAAFIGAMTKMALSYAAKGTPEVMLGEMCRGIADHMPEGKFVTAAAAIYHSRTRELFLARGGHPPGFLYHKAAHEIEELAPSGLPLGVEADATYELYQRTLEVGDRFLLVTDGLTETTDMNGAMFGAAGVKAAFLEAATMPLSEGLKAILRYHHDFTGGRIIKDDITLIGLECV